jgi:hypothetical protein
MGGECAKRTLSKPGQTRFQTVHGAWRDSVTALFQDFVAHETHRLIPLSMFSPPENLHPRRDAYEKNPAKLLRIRFGGRPR